MAFGDYGGDDEVIGPKNSSQVLESLVAMERKGLEKMGARLDQLGGSISFPPIPPPPSPNRESSPETEDYQQFTMSPIPWAFDHLRSIALTAESVFDRISALEAIIRLKRELQ